MTILKSGLTGFLGPHLPEVVTLSSKHQIGCFIYMHFDHLDEDYTMMKVNLHYFDNTSL